jgi:NACHT domain
MPITRQITADKISDYLHGKLSQAELVDWAERAIMESEFDKNDTELLTDVVGRLGLADAAGFELHQPDYTELLQRLGHNGEVNRSAGGIIIVAPGKTVSGVDTRKIQRLKNIKDEVREFHPVLQRLLPKLPGVFRVEYTHSCSEHGADFVLSKTDLMVDLQSYSGVIAKAGNIGKSEAHRIIEQVRECHGERLFLSGKQKIILSEILVITNGTIAEHAKRLIHDQFAASKIHFIDRDHLVTLIDKHLQSFWTDVDVHLGDYLSTIAKEVEDEDRELSLIPYLGEWFYIDQDIVRFRSRDFAAARKRQLLKIEPVKLFEEIKTHRFILIEGDAGVGKSKCAREIARLCCDPKNYHDAHFVPLRSTCAELFNNFDGDLERLVQDRLTNYPQLFEDKKNQFLVIIDGLDELKQGIEEANKQIKHLSETLEKRPKLRLVLFSRTFISEFGESLTAAEATRLEVLPLSLSKTIQFIKRLVADRAPSSRLFEDLKHSAIFNQLPRSPIAAILLARILREKQTDLPSTLPELYRKYFELALGRWDVDRGLQSEKEYEALDAVLMNIADFVMENQLDIISYPEAVEFFSSYLGDRNLGLTANHLIDLAAKRCPILRISTEKNTFAFKHRTFAEFLFAKKVHEQRSHKFPSMHLAEKAFTPYWVNTLYFYVGLQPDCPDLLKEIIELDPGNETAAWIKTFYLADMLLAAYTTPYNVITEGVKTAALHATELYFKIISGESLWGLDELPEIHILGLLQYFFKQRYAYEFLQNAIPEAVQEIALSNESSNKKGFAIFFLSMTYKQLGGKDNFDFLLTDELKPLPMPIQVFLASAAHEMKGKSKLLRRHEKRILDGLKKDPKLRNYVKGLFERPARSVASVAAAKALPNK